MAYSERARHLPLFTSAPRFLVVEARFHADVADFLYAGVKGVLEAAGATHDRIDVPGALEIPAAIAMAHQSGRYDGYVALGCVIRGDTYHFEIVCNESSRGLTDLGVIHGLAIGNGILTCNTMEQALARARPDQQDKGGDAAYAALKLLALRGQFGLI